MDHKPGDGAAAKILSLKVDAGRLRAQVEWTDFGTEAVKMQNLPRMGIPAIPCRASPAPGAANPHHSNGAPEAPLPSLSCGNPAHAAQTGALNTYAGRFHAVAC